MGIIIWVLLEILQSFPRWKTWDSSGTLSLYTATTRLENRLRFYKVNIMILVAIFYWNTVLFTTGVFLFPKVVEQRA